MIFLNSPNSLQEIIHSIIQQIWVYQVWWLTIDWIDLPKLTTFTTGSESFFETRSLSLSSLMIGDWLIDLIFLISPNSLQEMLHSIQQHFWVFQIWWMMIDWFNLPNLTEFTTGDESLFSVTTLCVESMMIDYWLIWSSWTDFIHYRKCFILRNNKFEIE